MFPPVDRAAEAQARSAVDGRPVVYRRAGCTYCLRLRFRLGRGARRLHWVHIWRDPAVAAALRAVHDGAETVPIVMVQGRPYVNPYPHWVRTQVFPPT
ncbi:glutaredoxin family protein [Streptomyces sp. CB01883]|uniref:glutaredoxin family protein n=1 Tax=Streptomyces sp. CB01883 TaxID=1703943 RepID=UPI003FD2FC85